MASWVAVTLKRVRDWVMSLTARPPGRAFHLLLVAATLAILYSWSVPGFHLLVALFAGYALFGAVIVWVLRLVGFVVARRRQRTTGKGKWFALAPLGAAAVSALLWVDAPLRLRWTLSRDAFERVVYQVQRGDGAAERQVPFGRLGLYEVLSVMKVETGVLFYEKTGNFLDDAGFAYLPSGPSADLENGSFENPQFRSLGGGWYAWTASW